MIVWLAASVVLVLVAWAMVRTWREAPPDPRTLPTKRPIAKSAPSAKGKPARGGGRPQPPRRESAEEPSIPNLAEEDDDEVEITVITASPATHPPPSDDVPIDEEPPTSDAMSQASKIEVIYEDEADVEEITSPIARILVSAEGQSDGGKVRRRNEDSMLVLPERSLFVVADGMGGYAGGDVASNLAVETLRRAFEKGIFDGKTESATMVPRRGREMACAIQMANHAILARAQSDRELTNMGTTIVAARFSPNKQRVYIGHVGDSRCYRLRGTSMRQLTTDHTMLGLGMKGPGSQFLYQAVGVKAKITIDVVVDKPRPDDVYLLCSDGLSKMASDDDVREALIHEPDLEAAVYGLIELANDRGGKDNITVILVKVLERAPGSTPGLPR
jgi:serine/threonine protein phosphatase PrpC